MINNLIGPYHILVLAMPFDFIHQIISATNTNLSVLPVCSLHVHMRIVIANN